MIQVKDLTKRYNELLAVDRINFKIKKNEVVALLGLNGAGKTTTLRLLSGFLTPTQGSVRINSYDLLNQPMELKKQIGYLPETPSLYLDMRVIDFLRYMYRIRLYTKDGEEKAIKNALEKTNTTEQAFDYIGTLSAGYRKRVGLAQALVHNPPVLILDEPISELDPLQIIDMRNLILSLKREHTIFISSHILSEVSKTADRFLFIKKGKLPKEETAASLKKKNISLEKFFMEINKD